MTIQYLRPTSDAEIADGTAREADRVVRPSATVVRVEPHGAVGGGGRQIVRVARRPVGADLTVVTGGETFSLQFEGTVNSQAVGAQSGRRLNVPKTVTVVSNASAEVAQPSVMRIRQTAAGTAVATLLDSEGSDLALSSLMDDLVTDAAAADVAAVVNVDNVDTAVLEGQFTVGISYQAAVADREAFETAFKADLAALLGIEPELIAIQGLSPGSCKVDFTVLLAENHASVTGTLDEAAEALRTTLEAPMGDPTAVFHNISTSILGGEALGATQLSRSIGVKTVVPAAESEDAGANAAPDPEPDPEPEPAAEVTVTFSGSLLAPQTLQVGADLPDPSSAWDTPSGAGTPRRTAAAPQWPPPRPPAPCTRSGWPTSTSRWWSR